MHNSIFFNFTWALGTLIELAICITLLSRRTARQWPSVLVYCLFSFAFDIALISTRGVYKHYFYTYWSWMILSPMFRLWILSDTVSAIPGNFFSARVRWIAAGASATMAIGAWRLTYYDTTVFAKRLIGVAVTLERCVSIAWGAFLVGILISAFILGLQWDRRTSRVFYGLGIQIVSAMITTYMFSFLPAWSRVFTNYLQALTAIAGLLVWLYAFLSPAAVTTSAPARSRATNSTRTAQ